MGKDCQRKQKQKATFSGPFAGIPIKTVEKLLQLNPWAIKLYLHLLRQYDGYNNGKMTCVYSELLNKKIFNSETTIKKAKDNLLQAKLIKQTAISNRRSKKPDRFAVTDRLIDWTSDMDKTEIKPP